MLHTLRYAIRQLRKSPGFTTAAIVTLGLGIGATTAMFSLVNAVLLRPLPFPEPDRLVWIQYDASSFGGNGSNTFSYANFFDYRAQQHSFSAIASYRGSGHTLIGAGEAQQVNAEVVSQDFFRVLGVGPYIGRDFRLTDEKEGVRSVVLSWDLWQRVFSGRRELIGGSINLDGSQYEVAGVMPAGFSFPIETPAPDLWISASQDAGGGKGAMWENRSAGFLNMIGRLRPGVQLGSARADMQVIATNLAERYPKENYGLTQIIAKPELDEIVGDTRPALRVLFAAVGAVLLIACVNVAGLLLARASRRRSEIGVLAALGASRGAILRQVLVESILLSVAGGGLGVLLSVWMVDAVSRLLPTTLPRFELVTIDMPVLIFGAVLSIATGLVFGIVPAWRMSRVEPIVALREHGRGATTGRQRLQDWLVIAETALGLVLLVGSGLLVRSFLRVLAVHPGFDAHNVVTVNMSVPENRYSSKAQLRLYNDLAPKLAALPGVQSVAAGWPLPLSNSEITISFEIQGRPVAPGAEPSEHLGVATPGFFRSMGIPLLAGRDFTTADNVHGPGAMMVNEAFAKKYFPGENAVGKRIKPGISDGTYKAVMREIVGVVGSVKRRALTAEMDPQYYLPWEQALITWPTITIRSATDPSNLVGAVRDVVAGIDREIPVYRVSTMENIVSRASAGPRFQTLLLGSFASMALFLAGIGLYAVLSYMVVQRSGEIGVRMALGAQRACVLGLILGRGARLAGAGLAIGLAASVVLTRQMSGMLYGVRPLDPVTLAVVSAILLAVSIAASLAPAYRAARVDPMRVLRDQ
jgi:putative ABC transport system permease protein